VRERGRVGEREREREGERKFNKLCPLFSSSPSHPSLVLLFDVKIK
jgi:hypothetical protein